MSVIAALRGGDVSALSDARKVKACGDKPLRLPISRTQTLVGICALLDCPSYVRYQKAGSGITPVIHQSGYVGELRRLRP